MNQKYTLNEIFEDTNFWEIWKWAKTNLRIGIYRYTCNIISPRLLIHNNANNFSHIKIPYKYICKDIWSLFIFCFIFVVIFIGIFIIIIISIIIFIIIFGNGLNFRKAKRVLLFLLFSQRKIPNLQYSGKEQKE